MTRELCNMTILLDEEDGHLLDNYPWRESLTSKRKGLHYFETWRSINGKKFVYLHRVIMKAMTGDIIDHINGDTLDNRKSNLRFVNFSHNNCNKRGYASSGYKGVYPNGPNKWQAKLSFSGRQLCLGTYDNLEDAARAYDAKALELFGEYARLNFPMV